MSRRFRVLQHGVPILAVAMFSFATWSVVNAERARPQSDPPEVPATSRYKDTVAGVGLVEPASETIALAIDRGGVVAKVHVTAGQKVKAGDPLFAIDDRDEKASVAQAEANVAAAAASLSSIERNIVLQKALVAQAEANRESTMAERDRSMADRRRYDALVKESWASRQRYEQAQADARKSTANVAASSAALESARRQVQVLEATREEAVAKLDLARAAADAARITLDKTVVRAPIDGAILKVNVRLGEYAQAGVLADALMTMGAVDPLHVRVDIDETEAQRVRPTAKAIAHLRGAAEIEAPITFVRFEPFVIPKRQLTGGGSGERVDTRVLQVIYAFDPKTFPAFVGQQVDVFVDAGAEKPVALAQ